MKSNLLILLFLYSFSVFAQDPTENDYYRIAKIAIPEGIILEAGGMATMSNGNVVVSSRRGDVYIVESPYSSKPYFRKFATGLHEILGLAIKDDIIYCAQRGELTRLMDKNNDGKADKYETDYCWPISGHYHE